jgi:chromate transporter
MDEAAGRSGARLAEIAAVFLKLGVVGFGGPAAHVALMEEEVVRRRGWISPQRFLDLLGATNLIPGPNSTELAIHLGHARAGGIGLLVAGTCFIAPAVLIVWACAWAYVRFGALPQAQGLLYGVKPVIIAVVLQALWRLGRAALKTKLLAAVAVTATVLSLVGTNELLVLLAAGASVAAVRLRPSWPMASALPLTFASTGAPVFATGAAVPIALGTLFLFFLKVGSVLFGSGYVLLAFLRADLVEHWGWLSEAQLLDAVAIGQVTPGPLFSTATFIGYLLAGTPGAALATLGIFLPAFVFVAASGPLVPRLRASNLAGAFLDGVNAGSLALMAAVTWQLQRAAIVDVPTLLLAAASAILLLGLGVNPTALVAGGAVVGWMLA